MKRPSLPEQARRWNPNLEILGISSPSVIICGRERLKTEDKIYIIRVTLPPMVNSIIPRYHMVLLAPAALLALLVVVSVDIRAEDSLGHDPWPTFMKDLERQGVTNESINRDNTTIWTYDAHTQVYSPPVVVDGIVYFTASGTATLHAVDHINGEDIWAARFPQAFVWQSMTVDVENNQLYIANDMFYALDLSSGEVIWKFDTDMEQNIEINTPVYDDGRVYFGSLNGKVYCVPAVDPDGSGEIEASEVIWEFLTGNYVGDEHEDDSEGWIYGTALAVDGRVYFTTAEEGGNDGGAYVSKMYCLDAQSGEALWVYNFGSNDLPYTSDDSGAGPSADIDAGENGLVFVGNVNTLYAFDIEGETDGDSPTDVDNFEEGEVVWSFDSEFGYIFSTAAIHDGKVFTTTSDRRIYALNEGDGSVIWSFETGASILGSPAVSDGLVIFGSDDGKLYVHDIATNTSVWSYQTGSGIHSSPAVYDERVYVGSNDGRLYAFSYPEYVPPVNPAIEPGDIHISAPAFAGGSLKLFAAVTNTGNKSAWDVTVSFFRNSATPENLLGNTTIHRVRPFDQKATAILEWVPDEPGMLDLLVRISQYPEETSYADNEGRASFLIQTGNARPVARILTIEPSHIVIGKDDVFLEGEGQDDGSIIAYEWSSSLDEGVLSTEKNFWKSASEMEKGIHIIYLRVKDDTGQWSEPVIGRLLVEKDFDDDWAMYCKDLERAGHSSSTLPFTNTPEPTWVHETGDAIISSPSIVDGVVYIASNDLNVSALDYFTGELIWKTRLAAPPDSTPAIDAANNRLYVCADVVYALDIRDGSIEWTFDTLVSWERNSPVFHDDLIFVGSLDGYMYAIDADGQEVWSFATGTYVGPVREPDSEGWIHGSPTVVEGKVFFSTANERGVEGGTYSSKMYALEESTGDVIWTYNFGDGLPYTGAGAQSHTGPSVDMNAGANGLVFAADAHVMYAFDVEGQSDGDSPADTDLFEEGELVWEYDPENRVGNIHSSGTHHNGLVFFASGDWFVYALHEETGQLAWEYMTNYEIYGSVVIAENLLYMGGADSNLYCFDLAGNLVWFYRTGSMILSTPAIYNDGLVLTSVDSNVYAFTLYRDHPDLALDDGLVLIDGPALEEGGRITLTAGIRNLGYADSFGDVSFSIDGRLIYETRVKVKAQSIVGATYVWNPSGFLDPQKLKIEVKARSTDTRSDNDVLVLDLADQYLPQNTAPVLTIIEPDGDADLAGEQYTIVWSAEDQDDDTLSIDLYFDTDTDPANGLVLIALDLPNSGYYEWDCSEVGEGDYYIYAVADDNNGSQVGAYSLETVTISHFPHPTESHLPEILITMEKADDHRYSIDWEASDEDGEALTVNLYYDQDKAPTNGWTPLLLGQAAEGSFLWEVSSLPAGIYYVAATVEDGTHTVTTYSDPLEVGGDSVAGGDDKDDNDEKLPLLPGGGLLVLVVVIIVLFFVMSHRKGSSNEASDGNSIAAGATTGIFAEQDIDWGEPEPTEKATKFVTCPYCRTNLQILVSSRPTLFVCGTCQGQLQADGTDT